MSNFSISSAAMSGAARVAAMSAQRELAVAQTEIATGKKWDVGLQLGPRSSELLVLRQTLDLSAAIRSGNEIASTRLSASQAALTDIDALAGNFLNGLLAARTATPATSQLEAQARTLLNAFTAAVNVDVGGEYLFGGLNSNAPPLADYFAEGGSPARTSLQSAFQSAFGITSSDAGVNGIEPAAMATFINAQVEFHLEDDTWSTYWSRASQATPILRVSLSEMQEGGASAYEVPFRQLAMALTIASDLGGTQLTEPTRAVAVGKAIELVGDAISGLTSIRSRLGLSQERITVANERLSLQADLIRTRRSEIEDVDQYATALKLNDLMRRLEASYATTVQIQRLSILDYLR